MTSADVAVLGAGPAGLAAAWLLAERGAEVVVLERGEHLGGLAASFEVAGLRVDHGSHRLHPSIPPVVLAELRGLLGDDLQVRTRRGRMALAGTLVAYPPRAPELVRRLPPSVSVRLARDVVAGPFRRARGDTFAEHARAALGSELTTQFHFPYVRKLFGVEPEELSAELARRRLATRGARDLARRLTRRGCFLYPRRGFGAIPDALAEAAIGAGAEVRGATEVVAVRADGTQAEVRCADGTVVEAAEVWSTIPLPVLVRLAGAPADVVAAAAALEYRALVLCYLVLEVPRWTEFDAHYLPGPEVAAVRVSEPRNYRDSADDPPDVTVLCAEVPCTAGDGSWDATPDELAAALVESLGRVGLPPVVPVAVETRRVAHAYPVYRCGFERHLERLETWAGGVPRLLSLGRGGLFAHDNTHHALATAWAAVGARGPDGRVDRARWAAARTTFAGHVVED